MPASLTSTSKLAHGGVFIVVAMLWLFLDRMTKAYFESTFELGQVADPGFPFIRFQLVHNTGAAWGAFGDSTFVLGVFSVIVCAAVFVAYLRFEPLFERTPRLIEAWAFALVIAGGIGNAVDRFAFAYVTDFIELSFVDFPVFNIADIGVTCGFALIILSLLSGGRSSREDGPARSERISIAEPQVLAGETGNDAEAAAESER